MKKYVCFILVLGLYLFSTSSCLKKETAICSYSIYYLPFGFAFQGFTTDEVDTLFLKRYDTASNFTILQGIDTLYTANYDLIDSTIYHNSPAGSGFGALTIGSDYILELPSLQTNIKIKAITQGPTRHSFEVDGHCSPGAGAARFGLFKATFESPYQVSLWKGKTASPPDNIALVKK